MSIRAMIRRVSVPTCGVMLACFSLGFLLHAIWVLHIAFGILGAILLVLVIAHVALYPREVIADLASPTVVATAATFCMSLLVASTYFAPVSLQVGFAIWIAGLALYAVNIGWFIYVVAKRRTFDDATPSCFIVSIGAVIACMTGVDYHVEAFLTTLFWAELAVTVVALGVVGARCIVRPLDVEVLLPLICIFAAPPAICLSNYLALPEAHSFALASTLFAVSCVCYLIAFANIIRCLRLRFYPTYAAMTFPFVIAATATTHFAEYMGMGVVGSAGANAASAIVPWLSNLSSFSWLDILASTQTAIAIVLVVYVLARYVGISF